MFSNISKNKATITGDELDHHATFVHNGNQQARAVTITHPDPLHRGEMEQTTFEVYANCYASSEELIQEAVHRITLYSQNLTK